MDSNTQLTPTQIAELEAIASNWRLTPATLAAAIDPSFMAPPWVQMASQEIAVAIYKGSGRLLFNAPPRHGKSHLVSTFTPLWALENFPNKHVVITSYGEDLAKKFTSKIRDFMQRRQDLLTVRIRPDVNRVDEIQTTEGGSLRAIGRRGAITGTGADILIIDDYLKNAEEALNPAIHESIWEWFVGTIRTRLEPGATIIVNATRWDIDDVHGRIIKNAALKDRLKVMGVSREQMLEGLRLQGYDLSKHKATTDANATTAAEEAEVSKRTWILIKFQALAEPVSKENPFPDPLGRKIGEALFPERFSKEDLEEIRDEIGSHWFGAQFQQNPVSHESKLMSSGLLRFIHPKDLPKLDSMRKVRVWDLAGMMKQGDYTVGTRLLYHVATDTLFIEDIRRSQWSPAQVLQQMISAAKLDALKYPDITQLIEQEPGSQSKILIAKLQADDLRGMKVVANPSTKKKELRASPLVAAAERGRVCVVLQENGSPPPWYLPLAAEWDAFPMGDHDDQMDTVAAGYLYTSGKKPMGATWGRKENHKDGKSHDLNQGAWDPNKELEDPGSIYAKTLNELVIAGRLTQTTQSVRKRVIFGRPRT